MTSSLNISDLKEGDLALVHAFFCQDSSLDKSTIGNRFIRVNGSVWFLLIEEVSDELDGLESSGRLIN